MGDNSNTSEHNELSNRLRLLRKKISEKNTDESNNLSDMVMDIKKNISVKTECNSENADYSIDNKLMPSIIELQDLLKKMQKNEPVKTIKSESLPQKLNMLEELEKLSRKTNPNKNTSVKTECNSENVDNSLDNELMTYIMKLQDLLKKMQK